MSFKDDDETFVMVAFRYDRKRSVYYGEKANRTDVAKEVYGCLTIDEADFIIIRKVYPCQPAQPSKT